MKLHCSHRRYSTAPLCSPFFLPTRRTPSLFPCPSICRVSEDCLPLRCRHHYTSLYGRPLLQPFDAFSTSAFLRARGLGGACARLYM